MHRISPPERLRVQRNAEVKFEQKDISIPHSSACRIDHRWEADKSYAEDS